MARIRTIKPEFFTSADIVSLSPMARLFYIALWCEADREGRLKWDVRTLKLRYFPGDDFDINVVAAELTDAGLVVLYEAGSVQYAAIPTFAHHQIINNREKPSAIPAESDASPGPFDASATRESGVSGEGKGKEGKGKEYSEAKASGDTSPPDPAAVIFGIGLPLLVQAGTPEKQARSFLGVLRKRAGSDAVVDALQRCVEVRPIQPIEWLAAALPDRKAGRSRSGKTALPPGGIPGIDDVEAHPKWAIDAGFENVWVANNAGCYARNARQFADGRRVAA